MVTAAVTRPSFYFRKFQWRRCAARQGREWGTRSGLHGRGPPRKHPGQSEHDEKEPTLL